MGEGGRGLVGKRLAAVSRRCQLPRDDRSAISLGQRILKYVFREGLKKRKKKSREFLGFGHRFFGIIPESGVCLQSTRGAVKKCPLL